MPNARVFFKYWLPLLLWMLVIFTASGDSGSFKRSSRIIGPLVHWLFPGMPEEQVSHVVTLARKGAHVTEYSILAFLVWRVMRKPVPRDPRPWNWRMAGAAVLFVTLYAATDELHQRFVPGREGSVYDVLIDTLGAALGMVLVWAATRTRRPSGAADTPPGGAS